MIAITMINFQVFNSNSLNDIHSSVKEKQRAELLVIKPRLVSLLSVTLSTRNGLL